MNDELFNGLVFGHTLGAVCAADWLHMATALFGLTVALSLSGLSLEWLPTTAMSLHPSVVMVTIDFAREKKAIVKNKILCAREMALWIDRMGKAFAVQV